MLKFIFWFLLCINGILFAYGRGFLGNFKGNEREPARMKNQVNTGKLTLVSAAQALEAAPAGPQPPEPAAPGPAVPGPAVPGPAVPKLAVPRPAVPEPEPAPQEPKPALIACTEIGNFTAQEARRFDGRIAALRLLLRPERQDVAGSEITSHMVHIPPQASREAAERRAAELKELGVTNYYIMPDNTPLKWAISLGVFKSENAAKTLLAALNRQGVADARISARETPVNRVAYRFRDIDAGTAEKLKRAGAAFPAVQARSCR